MFFLECHRIQVAPALFELEPLRGDRPGPWRDFPVVAGMEALLSSLPKCRWLAPVASTCPKQCRILKGRKEASFNQRVKDFRCVYSGMVNSRVR